MQIQNSLNLGFNENCTACQIVAITFAHMAVRSFHLNPFEKSLIKVVGILKNVEKLIRKIRLKVFMNF